MTDTTSTASVDGSSVDVDEPASKRPTLTLLTVGTGALLVALTQTLLVPVLSELPEKLGTSHSNVQWLLTAPLIVAAISIPIMGRLADMFGKRLIFLIALVALTVGSLVDALTSDVGVMIAGRAVQGVSMATIPIGISLLASTLPSNHVPRAIAMVSAMMGVGSALALPAAAYISEYADYHLLFWITAVGGALCAVATITWVEEVSSKSGGRVDYAGVVVFAAAIVATFLPLAQGSDWGWTSGRTLGLFAAAIVLLVVFYVVESRRAEPLVDVAELRRRPIAISNIASALFGFALFASLIGTAGFVQAPEATGYGFGASIVVGGLCLLPSGLLMLVLAPISARLISAYSPEVALMAGALVVSLGWVLRIFVSGSIWQVVIGTSVVGIGTGVGYAAMPALVTKYTARHSLGAATSLNTLSRYIGNAAASALGGSLLVMSTIRVESSEYPALGAYHALFAICAVSALLAAALMLLMPK